MSKIIYRKIHTTPWVKQYLDVPSEGGEGK